MLEESPARGTSAAADVRARGESGMRRAHEDTVSVQKEPMDSRRRAQREQTTAKSRDLSRDDLLFLLSMLEGEVQVAPKSKSHICFIDSTVHVVF